MTNNRVKSYADRIENVLDEIEVLKADIADIYQEVKSAELKPKVLRKAIANKRRKTDAQFEADVEEYAALLLALPGATYRGVAEQTGIPKSTLQRRVPRKTNGTTTPHDPETGEITNAASPSGQSDNGAVPQLASTPQGEEGASTTSVEQGDRQSPLRDGGAPVATSTAGPAVTTHAVITHDDLAPPDFLRRVPT